MISEKYKFIFSHIPKTCGVSIDTALRDITGEQKTRSIHHKGIDHAKKFIKLPLDQYFKFCFIRNPWDRFVSAYCYFKKNGRGHVNDLNTGEIVNRFSSFSDFVRNFEAISSSIISPHFKPQVNWIDDRIDFVGRFETLQQDFDTICNKVKISTKQLPHKNKSEHKHYTEYYDDETRDIVAERYVRDIEHFGYKFRE